MPARAHASMSSTRRTTASCGSASAGARAKRLGLRLRRVGSDDRLGVHQADLLEQRRGERLLGDEPVRDEHLAESATGALVFLERQFELAPAQQPPLDEQLTEGKPGSGLGGHHLSNRPFLRRVQSL